MESNWCYYLWIQCEILKLSYLTSIPSKILYIVFYFAFLLFFVDIFSLSSLTLKPCKSWAGASDILKHSLLPHVAQAGLELSVPLPQFCEHGITDVILHTHKLTVYFSSVGHWTQVFTHGSQMLCQGAIFPAPINLFFSGENI